MATKPNTLEVSRAGLLMWTATAERKRERLAAPAIG